MTPFKFRKKLVPSFVLIFFAWIAGFIWFVQQVPKQKLELDNSVLSSSATIVVLTGGNGRLEYGLQLLAEGKYGEYLFISGVGKNVTVQDIVNQASAEIRREINKDKIILGHDAENTIGNAEEIKAWLKDHYTPRIILVTSNYHIPRSLLELSTALPDISITPAPVTSGDYNMLLSEYHKYIASRLRHLFVSLTEDK